MKILARAPAGSFCADEQAIHEAIRARRSFNIVHLDTLLKVRGDRLDRAYLGQRASSPDSLVGE